MAGGSGGCMEQDACSRVLCEMVLCHPSKCWFCCLGLLLPGVCGREEGAPWWCTLCLGEKLVRLCGRMTARVTFLETIHAVFDMFVMNCGGQLAGRCLYFLSRSTLGSFCFVYYSCH